MNYQDSIPIIGELQTIALNRGTTLELSATRRNEQGTIIDEAEEVYFVVKKRWSDKEGLIVKSLKDMKFNNGKYTFTLFPEDTENLPYGQYVWDFTVVDDNNEYRVKPAHGYLIVGNSAGWISNEV